MAKRKSRHALVCNIAAGGRYIGCGPPKKWMNTCYERGKHSKDVGFTVHSCEKMWQSMSTSAQAKIIHDNAEYRKRQVKK